MASKEGIAAPTAGPNLSAKVCAKFGLERAVRRRAAISVRIVGSLIMNHRVLVFYSKVERFDANVGKGV